MANSKPLVCLLSDNPTGVCRHLSFHCVDIASNAQVFATSRGLSAAPNIHLRSID